MRKVWKYEVELNSYQDDAFLITIQTKVGAKPLCVMIQGDKPCIWVEVNTEAPNVDVTLFCVGTGHGTVPTGARYLGSVQQGDYVWHLYY